MSVAEINGVPGQIRGSVPLEPTWADTLKSVSSELLRPFWRAESSLHYCFLPLNPNGFGQMEQKVYEFAKRFFIALVAVPSVIVTLPLFLSAFSLTAVSKFLEFRDYRYVKGNGAEIASIGSKIFHLNTCMFWGGFPYKFGGMKPAHERFDNLVERIKSEDPDILFLCEFNRTLSNSMVNAFKDKYPHFFVDVGLNYRGLENCIFIASRKKLVSKPNYICLEAPLSGIKRGFFALETEERWYLYTHLHPKDKESDSAIRRQQLETIQKFIDEKNKPCVLIGDLNIDRNKTPNTEYQEMIAQGYVDHSKDIEVTRPYKNGAQIDQAIDYVLEKGGGSKAQVNLLKTREDPAGPALSDHHALTAIFD